MAYIGKKPTDVPLTSADIGDETIDSDAYVDGSIDNAHIADDAIDSEHYVDGSIDAAHIASNAVTTAKINADAVTGAKIADDAIDSEHYTDGSIDNAHIADDAIDSEHYADGSIDNAHIADDAIDSEHYAAASIDTAHIATNQIDETLIKDAFVGDFTDATVTASDYFLHGDATDSGNTKKDTVQGILDLAGGGGAWTKIGTTVASDDATVTVTGLDSTYDLYCICGSEIIGASDNVDASMRFGDSGGVDSGASDYQWANSGSMSSASVDVRPYTDQSDSGIRITETATGRLGTGTGEALGFVFWLTRPADGTSYPCIGGTAGYTGHQGNSGWVQLGGARKSAITLDRVQILASSGNIASGRLTVWGVSHA